MTSSFQLRSQVAAILLLAPLAATVALPAQAQSQRATVATESIQSISVNADRGVSPGSTLRLEVRGSANARNASVAIGGSDIVVPLQEVAPGVYRGSYAVRPADRVDPKQLLTARLRFGGGEAVARSFSYPPAFQSLAVAPAPAATPSFGPTGGVQIERFTMRTEGRIEPGREIRFRLRGAPGADAWVDIPGVITGVDLAEVRPGLYEGAYTVRRRDDLASFDRAIATLRNGNQRLTARVAMDRDAPRDDRAPQITDMSPANGERVTERGRATISARLTDEGTGIDPNSVRLRLDGRDVSNELRLAGEELRYRSDLEPGRYKAELSVRDNAGNTTTKTWGFEIAERERGRDRIERDAREQPREQPRERVTSLPPGVLPLEVTSHVNNAWVDNSNGALAIQGRTAPNASVRVQVETVAMAPGVAPLVHQVLDQTVQADRNGVFVIPVTPSGFVIPGNRYDVKIRANYGGQTAEERLTLHRRQG